MLHMMNNQHNEKEQSVLYLMKKYCLLQSCP
jgi:hypothetical protein